MLEKKDNIPDNSITESRSSFALFAALRDQFFMQRAVLV